MNDEVRFWKDTAMEHARTAGYLRAEVLRLSRELEDMASTARLFTRMTDMQRSDRRWDVV